MDRKLLVDLLKDGMRYPPGRHRLLVKRCFDITVRPNQMVEVDEYENYATENSNGPRKAAGKTAKVEEFFHVGRSIVSLKDGEVKEEPGRGWPSQR